MGIIFKQVMSRNSLQCADEHFKYHRLLDWMVQGLLGPQEQTQRAASSKLPLRSGSNSKVNPFKTTVYTKVTTSCPLRALRDKISPSFGTHGKSMTKHATSVFVLGLLWIDNFKAVFPDAGVLCIIYIYIHIQFPYFWSNSLPKTYLLSKVRGMRYSIPFTTFFCDHWSYFVYLCFWPVRKLRAARVQSSSLSCLQEAQAKTINTYITLPFRTQATVLCMATICLKHHNHDHHHNTTTILNQ